MHEMGPHHSTVGLADAKHDEYEDVKKLFSGDHIASSFYENDGIHDGLEFPTEEEKHTLRRVSDSIPWSAYCECFRMLTAPSHYIHS